MPQSTPTDQLIADAQRLTTPRPFEPDFKKHQQRLADDQAAQRRLRRAGYTTHQQMIELAQENR